MSAFKDGWLPPTGYVVPGVAAAFLYETDSKIAYVECIISNPETTKQERYIAIDAIMSSITGEARRRGFRYLMGWSNNDSIVGHAKALGFFVGPPCHVLFREL